MKHHKVEILGKPNERRLDCFCCSPPFGYAGDLAPNYVQRVVLNDGFNRVLVGVYNHAIDIELIKVIARQAINRGDDVRF